MKRYVAIDSGKLATKVAMYDEKAKRALKFKFRTKYGAGDFRDDALEASTFLAKIGDTVYKIGNGASQEAAMETTKQTEIHRICVLTALAMCASSNETDEFYVAVGMPVKEYEIVEKREAYKAFILPDGEITVSLKTKSEKEPETKKFKVIFKAIYPESAGVLYLDMKKYAGKTAAVIDIGNLNINNTVWNNFELDKDYSLTDELGGNVMIASLSQLLSAEFSRCDERTVLQALKQEPENRKLIPIRPNKDIEERSKKMIDEFLLSHVQKIKRKCDAKQWSLDFMELAFIGGTTSLLKNEIRQVFGDTVYIPENPEYANVVGFLCRLCALKLRIVIPQAMEDTTKMTGEMTIPQENAKAAS